MATIPIDPKLTDLQILEAETIDQLRPKGEEEQDDTPKSVQDALKYLTDQYELEGNPERMDQLYEIKRNYHYYKGERVFWSENFQDWLTIDNLEEDPEYRELAPFVEDTKVNIVRAHGESIVSAAGASVPTTRFFPDDADSADDIATAKAYSKIAEKLNLENDAEVLCLKAFALLWIEGTAFSYVCSEYNAKKYGEREVNAYSVQEEEQEYNECPDCGSETEASDEVDDYGDSLDFCPVCDTPNYGIPSQRIVSIPYIESSTKEPKRAVKINIFGPMNVKIARYVKSILDTPYLILETDQHKALMQSLYPHIADKITTSRITEERSIRRPFNYTAELVTVRQIWLRPWAYNLIRGTKHDSVLDPKSDLTNLEQLYPDGCYAVFIGDVFAEARNESLDDYWTMTEDPTEDEVHGEPMMNSLVPIQDMKDDLNQLTMDTIRQSIGDTFIDTDLIDIETINNTEKTPGAYYPMRRPSGMGMDAGITQVQGASLSREVDAHHNRLDSDGQFVSGSFPSLYGGPNSEGSRTASEYSQSRTQALQRISIKWKAFKSFWVRTISNGVEEFVRTMVEDEKFVKPGNTSPLNVWIRQAELTGKTGNACPEASEQFPVTWIQKRTMLMDLIGLKDPAITATLFHPENVSTIARTLGWPDLFIPGELDRQKELATIQELIKSGPNEEQDEMTGEALMSSPSIPTDPDIDDAAICIQVGKDFLLSPVGQELKVTNPPAYANVYLHLKMHMMDQQMQMQQQQQTQMQEAPVQ